jgi:hypothetical protein
MPRTPWTPEQARENAKKGAYARWHAPKPIIPPAPLVTLSPDDWQATQLVRVEGHVERLHGLLAASEDAMGIDRLARSLATLTDLRRELAGKPKVKPQAAPRVKQASLPEPT